ncbi:MAG: substrate-binding domain-containing protein [candidate division KSB1 bacterium]|nr:substrate-binding domain-containing protein [candidate division KSB1 bacterium]
MFGDSRENSQREARYLLKYMQHRVDGLIVYPALDQGFDDNIQQLLNYKIPFVLIDKYSQQYTTDSVVCDDVYGGYTATRHLIEQGHRCIAYITGPSCTPLNNRRKGYEQALKEAGIPLRQDIIIRGDYDTLNDQYNCAEPALDLLKSSDPPTAFFLSTDGFFPGLYHALHEAKYAIPDQVAIVGFGDVHNISFMDIPLTTMAYPKRQVGTAAAQLLFEKINGTRPLNENKQILKRPELIIRNTCGAAKQSTPNGER